MQYVQAIPTAEMYCRENKSALVLAVALAPKRLVWTWAGVNPEFWFLQKSPDGILGWAENATIDGALRERAAVLAGFYRLTRARGNPLYLEPPWSNIVEITP